MSEIDYFEMNRHGWDERARVHLDSTFYDVPGFLAGKNSLTEIELAEMGPVDGSRLLHLQCHFGLDTLSWERLGAHCTGVDISPVAIKQAEDIRDELGLQTQFVCANVYEYQRGDSDPFDIVFTSFGAVCWLPDLARWAQLVADNLASGGTFYMAEFHPVYDLIAGYSYFCTSQPDVEEEGTYTENGDAISAELATWAHPFTDVLNALIAAGIQIEQLNEFPYSPYNCFENMQEREPGRFYISHDGNDVPLVYSLRGRKSL